MLQWYEWLLLIAVGVPFTIAMTASIVYAWYAMFSIAIGLLKSFLHWDD